MTKATTASSAIDAPPYPRGNKSTRGRKKDPSSVPNRSRDIQREFRQRKSQQLADLEARVIELERENGELKLRLGEFEGRGMVDEGTSPMSHGAGESSNGRSIGYDEGTTRSSTSNEHYTRFLPSTTTTATPSISIPSLFSPRSNHSPTPPQHPSPRVQTPTSSVRSSISRSTAPTPDEQALFLVISCGVALSTLNRSSPDDSGGRRRLSIDEENYIRFCTRLMRGLAMTGKGVTRRDSLSTTEVEAATRREGGEVESDVTKLGCCGGVISCDVVALFSDELMVIPTGWTSISHVWNVLRGYVSGEDDGIKQEEYESNRIGGRTRYEPEAIADRILENGILPLSLRQKLTPGDSPLLAIEGAHDRVTLSNNIRCETKLGLIVVEAVVLNVLCELSSSA